MVNGPCAPECRGEPPLTDEQAELVESAVIYAFRVGRCSGARTGQDDGAPDGLWPMVLGTFPELRNLLPKRITAAYLEVSDGK
jgi:hypothetical protein